MKDIEATNFLLVKPLSYIPTDFKRSVSKRFLVRVSTNEDDLTSVLDDLFFNYNVIEEQNINVK